MLFEIQAMKAAILKESGVNIARSYLLHDKSQVVLSKIMAGYEIQESQ